MSDVTKNYTVYHLHDDTSNCNGFADSCSKFGEYIKLAKKQNMKAISFSNHGGIYDWIKKKQECDKAGLKYIHGVELYLCNKLSDDDRGSHIGLYAKNWEGVLELNKLVSISGVKGKKEDKSDRHMYYNPRISLDELMGTSDNIIFTSACLASPLNKWDTSERKEEFQTLVKWMIKNKHRCFFEIQYHNCESQILFNKKLYAYSKKTGIPLIAGTDTHSSSDYKAECRKILQKYKDSYYGEEDEFDLTWKTYDELVEAFKKQNALPEDVILEAIENTNVLADMVEEFTLDKAFKYPTLYGDNVREQWTQLIYSCFEEKRKNNQLKLPSKVERQCEKYFAQYTQIPTDETEKEIYECYKLEYEWAKSKTDKEVIESYKAKIIEEFKVMCKLGMESFMMFMSELITWANNNNIPCGTGRGSVCGSMIAFITNITDVDPIVWNTVFSRFCNEDRISLGDIDVDFAGEDREKVYQYIIQRFTPEKTAYIAAFTTLQTRGCIDALAGGLGYKDLDKVMEIKNKFDEYLKEYSKIVQAEVGLEELQENGVIDSTSVTFDNHTIYLSRINNDKIRKHLESVKKSYDALISENQDLFYYLDGLKGTIVAKGQHPSGIIGSPITLADNIGLYYRDGDENLPISTCAMKSVDSLNYVKFDILGLKTVGIIKDACEYAGIPYPKSYDLNWNDCKVWKNMIEAQQGVFQFEGDYAFSLLKDFKPTTINHMSMVNAALRPSGKSYRDRMIAGIKNENPSEEIDKLLESNNGYLIFQEDTIKFLTDICDFTGSAADTTRRCVDENTLILMGDGNYKKIKDIKIGDTVQSFNKYKSSEPKEVTNIFDNGYKKTYQITSMHGYVLNVTENHPVLTQRGYVKVKDLTLNDYIMTPRKINSTDDNKRPNQRLSSNDMYLIGLVIGDGSLAEPDYRVHFTNSEEILIEKFKSCIKNIGDGRLKGDCEFSVHEQNGVDVNKIYSIYIKSDNYLKSFISLLNKYNLRKLAKDKKIPNEFMLYPVGEKLTSLIAGLFNTDGGYNLKSKSIEYYSTSETLVIQIKSLLSKYGIYSYVQKKKVKKYDYYCYCICIKQKDSLDIFEEKILPYIIGRKHDDYQNIINENKNNSVYYNYLLPKECLEEIIESSKKSNISLSSIGKKLGYKDNCFAIRPNGTTNLTDTKAKNVIQHLRCPFTYDILFGDYFPLKIKSINENSISHVYDIEVKDNHNYVAENIIVHNCIGKKDKEELERQLPKILEGYCNHSPKERSIAEEEAKQFVQIVQDSSDYQFGYNHSTAYSMNGYECVWLRTYYPLEFMAAYLNRAENKDDINYGIELANQYHITINPIKYGKSSAKYTIDKENNAIYKGIESIKFCNAIIAEEMLELSKGKKYNSFIDLLDDVLKNTSIDNRQLKILTGLNFFSDYGKNKYLLNVIDLYNGIKIKPKGAKSPKTILPSFRTCKEVKKDKIEEYSKYGISEYLLQKYSEKESQKKYSQIDNVGLLNELISRIPNESMDIQEYVKFEKEYLQYVTYTNEDVVDYYYIVVDFKTFKDSTKPHVVLRNIKTGEEIKTKIKDGKIYRQAPFGEYSILRVNEFTPKHKSKRIVVE